MLTAVKIVLNIRNIAHYKEIVNTESMLH